MLFLFGCAKIPAVNNKLPRFSCIREFSTVLKRKQAKAPAGCGGAVVFSCVIISLSFPWNADFPPAKKFLFSFFVSK